MRFVFKFKSEPARSHFQRGLEDQLGRSMFVTIKRTNAKVPTLIVNTSRDDSMFCTSPEENTAIMYHAAVLHNGIVSMRMTHSNEKSHSKEKSK